VAVIDARNPFFTAVAQGIEEAAPDAGLSLILCNSNQSAEREVGVLVSTYKAGAVLVPTICLNAQQKSS